VPEHTSWLTFLMEHIKETLSHNAALVGEGLVVHTPPSWHSFEPILASLLIVLVILGIGRLVGGQLNDVDKAVVPDNKLTLRTFIEAFLGYVYNMAKDVMDAKRAKKYFPLIGASALFVFFSNIVALLPTFPVATSSLNITFGCALVVFVLFNFYGLMTHGMGYIAHFAGPAWYLAWLIFPIEVISLCVRPITLAVRLMLNMSVDHLILGIFMGLIPLLLPLPVMLLGVIVVLVQTLVFTMLTCIYIGLATEHEAH
jgi:F-type H+-transporting ATPase subunit a